MTVPENSPLPEYLKWVPILFLKVKVVNITRNSRISHSIIFAGDKSRLDSSANIPNAILIIEMLPSQKLQLPSTIFPEREVNIIVVLHSPLIVLPTFVEQRNADIDEGYYNQPRACRLTLFV